MYEEFYNFTANPFKLNTDPDFFFNSNTHKRALAYLRYGIKQEEGFIVITGDVGTGKSTLVSRLFKSLDTSNMVVANIVNTQLGADDLLQMVSAEFKLDYKDLTKTELLKNLESFFIETYKKGMRLLLVIDEAQNLAPKAIEELRMLSNITYDGNQLLQSFLLGQKEFRATMRMQGFEQLRQRVTASYHLRPLDQNEIKEYVMHRLKVVGWEENPKFDDEVFDEIHKFTKGIPRKTNLLCDRILLFAGLEQINHITYEILQSVLSDVEDEFWNADTNSGSLDFNFSDSNNFDDAQSVDMNQVSPHMPSSNGITLDDIYRRISILDNSMESLNEILKTELKGIRRALNIKKK